MQKILRLIARLIIARHECTYVQHCKESAPIYMYYVAPETPMMSSVIADCPDLAPQYLGQVYAYVSIPHIILSHNNFFNLALFSFSAPGSHQHVFIVYYLVLSFLLMYSSSDLSTDAFS